MGKPAFIYVFEFEDYNGTIFHKVGIRALINKSGRRWSDRLTQHRRNNGTLIELAEADWLTCRQAEVAILRHVGSRSYIPQDGRIDGGYSECYRAGPRINLNEWIVEVKKAHDVATTVDTVTPMRSCIDLEPRRLLTRVLTTALGGRGQTWTKRPWREVPEQIGRPLWTDLDNLRSTCNE